MSNGRRHSRQRRRGGGESGRRIPDRWLNYDPVGRDLEGTRFVPFKTPLDRTFFSNKPELTSADYFDVHTIVQYAREAGKKIGLVVDLTNTDRYYKKTDWSDYDIKYIKLNCPGHEVNDREDIVKQFFENVDTFLADSRNDDFLIGVHCTHGLNRTGYLICRYMIDKMGWTASKAISHFEHFRGHPIERNQYKRSLYEAEERLIQNDKARSALKDDYGNIEKMSGKRNGEFDNNTDS